MRSMLLSLLATLVLASSPLAGETIGSAPPETPPGTADAMGWALSRTSFENQWELHHPDPARADLGPVGALQTIETFALPAPNPLAELYAPRVFRDFERSIVVGKATWYGEPVTFAVGILAQPVRKTGSLESADAVILSVGSFGTAAEAISEAERIVEMYSETTGPTAMVGDCFECENQYRWCLILVGLDWLGCVNSAETIVQETLCGVKYEFDILRCTIAADLCLQSCGPI